MKDTIGFFILVLIAFAVGLLVGHTWRTTPKAHIITERDTLLVWDTCYIPQPAETIRVRMPSVVDTQYVVQEFYTEKLYRDTVFNNDTVMLVIQDTLWRNSLTSRTASLTFNASRFVKANSVGLQGVTGRNTAALMGVYRHKRLHVMAGYDFIGGAPMVGAGYTLKEW